MKKPRIPSEPIAFCDLSLKSSRGTTNPEKYSKNIMELTTIFKVKMEEGKFLSKYKKAITISASPNNSSKYAMAFFEIKVLYLICYFLTAF